MEWFNSIKHSLVLILRVPSLFVIDSILKNTFLWPWAPYDLTEWNLKLISWSSFNIICFVGALGIFILDAQSLITAHQVLTSGTSLLFSYYFNMWFVSEEKKKEGYIDDMQLMIMTSCNFIFNLAIQLTVSLAYTFLQQNIYSSQQEDSTLLFLVKKTRFCTFPVLVLPLLSRLMDVSPEALTVTPFVSLILMTSQFIMFLFTNAFMAFRSMKTSYINARLKLRNFGIQTFLEEHWLRLHIPDVLRIFFCVRITYSFVYLAVQEMSSFHSDISKLLVVYINGHDTSLLNSKNNIEDFVTEIKFVINWTLFVSQEALTGSCDTVVALVGMTSVVSKLAHYLGLLLAWYVQSNNEEDRSLGTMTAILFFILALQTGLTGMHPVKRIIRLYRNFCLVFTAILHFSHGMVNPLLMNLSASQHHHLHKHVRPLSMCFFLMTFPVLFLYYLWQENAASTWLLAVTAFSIEVVIKVFVSLLVYALFMIDAYREVFWEKLDDYVYYVKAFGNSIEFLFGIFLFCNGAWIMVFESGGTIRAIMMCIHAYFNIWVQAKEGWRTFIKRRTAVIKINCLPEASLSQLENFHDVCAICYQELSSARVTRCNHYFHGVCLRKWLYLQDVCPMCHEEIYAEESTPTNDDSNLSNGNVVQPHDD